MFTHVYMYTYTCVHVYIGVRGLRQMDQEGTVIVVCPNPSPTFANSACGASSPDGTEGRPCVEFSALEPGDLNKVVFDKTTAVGIDVDNQRVLLSDGGRIHYGVCVCMFVCVCVCVCVRVCMYVCSLGRAQLIV